MVILPPGGILIGAPVLIGRITVVPTSAVTPIVSITELPLINTWRFRVVAAI